MPQKSGESVDSGVLSDSIGLTESTDTSDAASSNATDTLDPIDFIDPMDPIDPDGPVDPINPTDPDGSVDPYDSIDRSDQTTLLPAFNPFDRVVARVLSGEWVPTSHKFRDDGSAGRCRAAAQSFCPPSRDTDPAKVAVLMVDMPAYQHALQQAVDGALRSLVGWTRVPNVQRRTKSKLKPELPELKPELKPESKPHVTFHIERRDPSSVHWPVGSSKPAELNTASRSKRHTATDSETWHNPTTKAGQAWMHAATKDMMKRLAGAE